MAPQGIREERIREREKLLHRRANVGDKSPMLRGTPQYL
jgi:hypothetical protein